MSAFLFVNHECLLQRRVIKTLFISKLLYNRHAEIVVGKWSISFESWMINCVNHKHQGCKINMSLHAVFDVVFGIIYFNKLVLHVFGQKMQFFGDSESFVFNSLFLVTLKSFFLSTFRSFQRQWLFVVSSFQGMDITKRQTFYLVSTKSCKIFRKKTFTVFHYQGPTSKIKKFMVCFSGEAVMTVC